MEPVWPRQRPVRNQRFSRPWNRGHVSRPRYTYKSPRPRQFGPRVHGKAMDAETLAIEAIIEENKRLVDERVVQVAPIETEPTKISERFANGACWPVYYIPSLPKLELNLYSSLEFLFVDLMGCVPFFFSAPSVDARRRVVASMVGSIRRHKDVLGQAVSPHYFKLEPWAWKLVKEDVPDGSTLPGSIRRTELCDNQIESLRDIASRCGVSNIYVCTDTYCLRAATLNSAEELTRDTEACVKGQPNLERRRMTSTRDESNDATSTRGQDTNQAECARPSRPSTPPQLLLTLKSTPYAGLARWYKVKKLGLCDPVEAINALKNKFKLLREEEVLYTTNVWKAPPICYALLEDGGSVAVYNCVNRPHRMETRVYVSLAAFFVDLMQCIVLISASTNEYEKRLRVASMVDAVERQRLKSSSSPLVWNELTAWTWRLASVETVNIADPAVYKSHLARCDLQLEELKQCFAQRLGVNNLRSIVLKYYFPPGTVWRCEMNEAFNTMDGCSALRVQKHIIGRMEKFISEDPSAGMSKDASSTVVAGALQRVATVNQRLKSPGDNCAVAEPKSGPSDINRARKNKKFLGASNPEFRIEVLQRLRREPCSTNPQNRRLVKVKLVDGTKINAYISTDCPLMHKTSYVTLKQLVVDLLLTVIITSADGSISRRQERLSAAIVALERNKSVFGRENPSCWRELQLLAEQLVSDRSVCISQCQDFKFHLARCDSALKAVRAVVAAFGLHDIDVCSDSYFQEDSVWRRDLAKAMAMRLSGKRDRKSLVAMMRSRMEQYIEGKSQSCGERDQEKMEIVCIPSYPPKEVPLRCSTVETMAQQDSIPIVASVALMQMPASVATVRADACIKSINPTVVTQIDRSWGLNSICQMQEDTAMEDEDAALPEKESRRKSIESVSVPVEDVGEDQQLPYRNPGGSLCRSVTPTAWTIVDEDIEDTSELWLQSEGESKRNLSLQDTSFDFEDSGEDALSPTVIPPPPSLKKLLAQEKLHQEEGSASECCWPEQSSGTSASLRKNSRANEMHHISDGSSADPVKESDNGAEDADNAGILFMAVHLSDKLDHSQQESSAELEVHLGKNSMEDGDDSQRLSRPCCAPTCMNGEDGGGHCKALSVKMGRSGRLCDRLTSFANPVSSSSQDNETADAQVNCHLQTTCGVRAVYDCPEHAMRSNCIQPPLKFLSQFDKNGQVTGSSQPLHDSKGCTTTKGKIMFLARAGNCGEEQTWLKPSSEVGCSMREDLVEMLDLVSTDEEGGVCSEEGRSRRKKRKKKERDEKKKWRKKERLIVRKTKKEKKRKERRWKQRLHGAWHEASSLQQQVGCSVSAEKGDQRSQSETMSREGRGLGFQRTTCHLAPTNVLCARDSSGYLDGIDTHNENCQVRVMDQDKKEEGELSEDMDLFMQGEDFECGRIGLSHKHISQRKGKRRRRIDNRQKKWRMSGGLLLEGKEETLATSCSTINLKGHENRMKKLKRAVIRSDEEKLSQGLYSDIDSVQEEEVGNDCGTLDYVKNMSDRDGEEMNQDACAILYEPDFDVSLTGVQATCQLKAVTEETGVEVKCLSEKIAVSGNGHKNVVPSSKGCDVAVGSSALSRSKPQNNCQKQKEEWEHGKEDSVQPKHPAKEFKSDAVWEACSEGDKAAMPRKIVPVVGCDAEDSVNDETVIGEEDHVIILSDSPPSDFDLPEPFESDEELVPQSQCSVIGQQDNDEQHSCIIEDSRNEASDVNENGILSEDEDYDIDELANAVRSIHEDNVSRGFQETGMVSEAPQLEMCEPSVASHSAPEGLFFWKHSSPKDLMPTSLGSIASDQQGEEIFSVEFGSSMSAGTGGHTGNVAIILTQKRHLGIVIPPAPSLKWLSTQNGVEKKRLEEEVNALEQGEERKHMEIKDKEGRVQLDKASASQKKSDEKLDGNLPTKEQEMKKRLNEETVNSSPRDYQPEAVPSGRSAAEGSITAEETETEESLTNREKEVEVQGASRIEDMQREPLAENNTNSTNADASAESLLQEKSGTQSLLDQCPLYPGYIATAASSSVQACHPQTGKAAGTVVQHLQSEKEKMCEGRSSEVSCRTLLRHDHHSSQQEVADISVATSCDDSLQRVVRLVDFWSHHWKQVPPFEERATRLILSSGSCELSAEEASHIIDSPSEGDGGHLKRSAGNREEFNLQSIHVEQSLPLQVDASPVFIPLDKSGLVPTPPSDASGARMEDEETCLEVLCIFSEDTNSGVASSSSNDLAVPSRKRPVMEIDLVDPPDDQESPSAGEPERASSLSQGNGLLTSHPSPLLGYLLSRPVKKQRLGPVLGTHYRERMTNLMKFITHLQGCYPNHEPLFSRLQLHVGALNFFTGIGKLREVVLVILDERCLENVTDLFENHLRMCGDKLNPVFREDLETTVDAVKIMLEETRTIAHFCNGS